MPFRVAFLVFFCEKTLVELTIETKVTDSFRLCPFACTHLLFKSKIETNGQSIHKGTKMALSWRS